MFCLLILNNIKNISTLPNCSCILIPKSYPSSNIHSISRIIQPGLKAKMSKLQGFQDKFVKKITTQTEATTKLGWRTLESRRFNCRVLLAHRIVKGENIQHLQDLVNRDELNSNYCFRENIFNRLPCPKTNWGKRSTTYTVFTSWRDLPKHLKKLMPINQFKKLLKKESIRNCS